jgi:hypothetical protein
MPKRLIGQTDSTGRLKKKKAGKGLGSLFSSADSGELTPERQALVDLWGSDFWTFLTATDPTTPGNPPVILTKDESDEKHPYKPFPQDRPYLRILAHEFFGPHQHIFVNKPRQVMATWCANLGLYWDALFKHGRKHFISKHKEEEASDLLRDKIRHVHGRTPPWFQHAYPLSSEPVHRADFLRTDSDITAVGQNAAVAAFRGPTPSIVLIDEAAFQETFAAMLQAAHASASRLWVLTTPNVGNPGAAECRAILNDGDASRYLAAERVEEEERMPNMAEGWDQR